MSAQVITGALARQLSDEELYAACWRAGRLDFLLHDDQVRVHKTYRAWEKIDPATVVGDFPRVFDADIARRWGKTTLWLAMWTEDCIQRPGSVKRISSAFQKNVEEIVDDVSRVVFATAPDDVKPTYHGTSKARAAGLYFPNGSVIPLVGLDKHPDGLRGRASDGDVISEAAFVPDLLYTVRNVLYSQYQGRPWARMILESSAPTAPHTDYDTVFVKDAKARSAYVTATIDDNPLLSERERDEFIAAAGGRDHPDCQREYFNVRNVDTELAVLPEFLKHRAAIVVTGYAMPTHCDRYVSADLGLSRDLTVALFGFYDFERGILVVEDELIVKSAEMHTDDFARDVQARERVLWGHVEVFKRVGDLNPLVIRDLTRNHALYFAPTEKHDKESAINELRVWLAQGRVKIHERCKHTIASCESALWNKSHKSFERTRQHGHADAVDALVYMRRNVAQGHNPFPIVHPTQNQHQRPVQDDTASTLADLFNPSRGRDYRVQR